MQKEDLEKAWPQFEESQNWYSKAEALISQEEKQKELKQLPSPDAPQTVSVPRPAPVTRVAAILVAALVHWRSRGCEAPFPLRLPPEAHDSLKI